MKVSDLTGAELDYWVAKGHGLNASIERDGLCQVYGTVFSPSADWSDGGPIIERENITLLDPKFCKSGFWEAFIDPILDVKRDDIIGRFTGYGPTPLIAAMRAYVTSKFGEEVPDATHPA